MDWFRYEGNIGRIDRCWVKKKLQRSCFPNFQEIFKNRFFREYLQASASDNIQHISSQFLLITLKMHLLL